MVERPLHYATILDEKRKGGGGKSCTALFYHEEREGGKEKEAPLPRKTRRFIAFSGRDRRKGGKGKAESANSLFFYFGFEKRRKKNDLRLRCRKYQIPPVSKKDRYLIPYRTLGGKESNWRAVHKLSHPLSRIV